jgi:hypothetical protein
MMQCLHEIAQRQLGFAWFDLALNSFQTSVKLGKNLHHWATPTVQSNQVFALITLGAFDQAQALLEELFQFPELRVSQRFALLRLQAMLYRQTGRDASSVVNELEQQAMPEQVIQRVKLDRLNEFSSHEQDKLCSSLLETAQNAGAFGGQIIIQTKFAQALMHLNPRQALQASLSAISLLEQYTPISFYRAETMLTHCQTLNANNLPAATTQLEKTLQWLLEITTQHVPAEYQHSFHELNPINKAILDAARMAGFSVQ